MRKIGVRQLAKLANVSLGTVDRALHDRKGISKSTKEHILAIANRVGYRPDPAARALSVGRVPLKVGVCIPREVHYYWEELLLGILTEARRLERLGLQILFHPTAGYGVEQVERVSELLESNIQGLIIAPGDPRRLNSLIDEAEKGGVRVVCVNSDVPASRRSTAVHIDANVAGQLAAELMSGFVDPNSEVAIISGLLDVEAHAKKTESFCAEYSRSTEGGKVVKVVEAHGEEEELFRDCFTLLQEFKSLAGLYVNTANCLPVCRAVCAHGLSGKITLITTDLFRDMVPYFEKGTIRASIHQRPFSQGEISIRLLVDHIVNDRPLPSTRCLAPQVVMRSNLRFFREIREAEDPGSRLVVQRFRSDQLVLHPGEISR